MGGLMACWANTNETLCDDKNMTSLYCAKNKAILKVNDVLRLHKMARDFFLFKLFAPGRKKPPNIKFRYCREFSDDQRHVFNRLVIINYFFRIKWTKPCWHTLWKRHIFFYSSGLVLHVLNSLFLETFSPLLETWGRIWQLKCDEQNQRGYLSIRSELLPFLQWKARIRTFHDIFV